MDDGITKVDKSRRNPCYTESRERLAYVSIRKYTKVYERCVIINMGVILRTLAYGSVRKRTKVSMTYGIIRLTIGYLWENEIHTIPYAFRGIMNLDR